MIDKAPLRALIYNRVSADPSGRRVSVESQDAENQAFCDEQGWTVIGTVTDNDRSASRWAVKEREGYQRVLAALDGGEFGRVDVLVTWESSRNERGLDGYVRLRERLERNRVLLAYKRRIYDMAEGDDRFTTGLDALLDEREAERARERTLRSHRASVASGQPRGFTPYGYQREYDLHSGRMIAQVSNPETAPVVREIVRRILDGETLYRVAQDLNEREILTPRGYRDKQAGRDSERAGWSSSMIRNMLRKQSLAGMRTYRGNVVREGTWEAIVSPADWAAVQAILDDPTRGRNPRGVAPRYLLSGIAECGVCGAWLRPLTNRGRPTYVCAGSVPTAGKGHVARARPPLDAMVVSAVVGRMSRIDARDLLEARQHLNEAAAAAARELADLEAQLAQYEESAATPNGISPAGFARIEARLLPKIDEARSRAVRLYVPADVAELAGPDAAERWDAMPLDRQRQAVRALLRVVVHRSTQRGSRGFDASSVELVWRS